MLCLSVSTVSNRENHMNNLTELTVLQMAYVSGDNSSILVTGSPQDGVFQKTKIPYRIFVGGIAFNTTKDELKDFFSCYGAVRDAKIIRDLEGLSKGYGFVTFYREEDAQKVMNMGTIFFKEKRLNISEAYRKQTMVIESQPAAAAACPVHMTAPTSYQTVPQVYYPVNQVPQAMQVLFPYEPTRNWHSVQQPGMVYYYM